MAPSLSYHQALRSYENKWKSCADLIRSEKQNWQAHHLRHADRSHEKRIPRDQARCDTKSRGCFRKWVVDGSMSVYLEMTNLLAYGLSIAKHHSLESDHVFAAAFNISRTRTDPFVDLYTWYKKRRSLKNRQWSLRINISEATMPRRF